MADLISIGLNTQDIEPAASFLEQALGFQRHGHPQRDTIPGITPAKLFRQRMRLGTQTLDLTAFETPGRPIAADSTSSDLWFQHIAIVVTDMQAAYQQLQTQPITPITLGGPQTLPPAAGSVIAYKFRDPEGHPFELLQFPPNAGPPHWQQATNALHLGYDHSAISVSDSDASIAFYRDRLGLTCTARQTNTGPAQDRLDAADDVAVEVVALQFPNHATPHLELLSYRHPRPRRSSPTIQINDSAATRLIFAVPNCAAETLIRDPDGHWIVTRPTGA